MTGEANHHENPITAAPTSTSSPGASPQPQVSCVHTNARCHQKLPSVPARAAAGAQGPAVQHTWERQFPAKDKAHEGAKP